MIDKTMENREIIFEFIPVGSIVKVSAIDTKTMTEAVIQGPASAGEATLRANAMRKLEYLMRKKGLI